MVLDVVIHDNQRFIAADEPLRIAHPPIEAKCDLGFQMYVGRIDHRIAKAVMDLVDNTCVGTPSPVRQFAHLYAFVRELPDQTSLVGWDSDNLLQNCVGWSRLIHPCSTGFRYAARVRLNEHGEPIELCKAEISGINIEAHVSPSQKRDWLTQAEGEELTRFIPAARLVTLPARVSNSLWYHEFAFRTWFADVRWTLICTALEALLNTDAYNSTSQFVSRSTQLALELGLPFAEDDAKTAYAVRSKLAHGAAFLYSLPKGELRIYDQMEAVLRASILRAMNDKQFAAIFDDPAKIKGRWPLSRKSATQP